MPVSLWFRIVAGCISLVMSVGVQAAAPKTEVMIWRLDCGQIVMNDASPLSDAGIYNGQSRRLSVGCYLIRHGKELMLWDAGLPTSLLGKPIDHQPISPTLSVNLPAQLARLGIRPEDITRLGLSHYHFDHAGQATTFSNATLMIGAGDWAALNSKKMPFGADPTLLAPWLSGKGKVDPIEGDRDVFGDGSVVILATPGHTPGSTALLVRLPETQRRRCPSGSAMAAVGRAYLEHGSCRQLGVDGPLAEARDEPRCHNHRAARSGRYTKASYLPGSVSINAALSNWKGPSRYLRQAKAAPGGPTPARFC
jgi:N-acyl homoserine lactone hydrolase